MPITESRLRWQPHTYTWLFDDGRTMRIESAVLTPLLFFFNSEIRSHKDEH